MARRVDLVHLVCFVHLVGLVQPNKRDKPNKPNNGLLTLAGFFSILLRPLELFERKLLGQHHWNDDPDGVTPLDGRWLCEL